jgi:hypothetical protein
VFSEAEANGYLAGLLSRAAADSASTGSALSVTGVNLAFEPEFFVALVLANWGPVHLSYELRGVPEVGPDGLGIHVLQARWGHLPLPGPVARWMGGRVAGLFARMDREREVLDAAQSIQLAHGAITVTVEGR